MSNHTVFVEESERSVFSRLISQIYLSEATQILVTGPSAGPFYWSDLKEIDESLKPPIDPDSAVKKCAICGATVPKDYISCPKCGKGQFDANITGSGWQFFGPPYAPTREKMIESIVSFSDAIKEEPQSRHMYIGPTYEDDVVERVFFPHPSHNYSCAIYILGIYKEAALAHLKTISQSVAGHPHMSGKIISIYCTVDITNQFKRRLDMAKDRNEDIQHLTLLYFELQELIKILDHSTDKQFIREIEKKMSLEIIPQLFPKELFPDSIVKPWWKFW